MNKAAQAYFKTKVSTTDQGQLLLLLYDGALNFLQQARDKMLAKDYAAKGVLISKVIDIVNELSGSLNLERGGELAENLNNLYFLCTARLLQANLKMNVEQLDSVSSILTGLRSAYAQILTTPEAQRAAQQIASQLRPEASMMQRAAVVTTAPNAGMPAHFGQMQARAAYGQQAAAARAVAPQRGGMQHTPHTPAAAQQMAAQSPAQQMAAQVVAQAVASRGTPAPVPPAAPAGVMPHMQRTAAPVGQTAMPTPPRPATVTHMPHPFGQPVQTPAPAGAPVTPPAATHPAPQPPAAPAPVPPAAPATPPPPAGGALNGLAASVQMMQKFSAYKKM